jgi:hypothetical protein
MSDEVYKWILGAGLVPLIGVGIYMVSGMRELLYMHRNPDKTEFGTVGIREVIQSNTQAFKDLRVWVEWITKEMGHQAPPPRVRGSTDQGRK